MSEAANQPGNPAAKRGKSSRQKKKSNQATTLETKQTAGTTTSHLYSSVLKSFSRPTWFEIWKPADNFQSFDINLGDTGYGLRLKASCIKDMLAQVTLLKWDEYKQRSMEHCDSSLCYESGTQDILDLHELASEINRLYSLLNRVRVI